LFSEDYSYYVQHNLSADATAAVIVTVTVVVVVVVVGVVAAAIMFFFVVKVSNLVEVALWCERRCTKFYALANVVLGFIYIFYIKINDTVNAIRTPILPLHNKSIV
jgi:hypothetical protein